MFNFYIDGRATVLTFLTGPAPRASSARRGMGKDRAGHGQEKDRQPGGGRVGRPTDLYRNRKRHHHRSHNADGRHVVELAHHVGHQEHTERRGTGQQHGQAKKDVYGHLLSHQAPRPQFAARTCACCCTISCFPNGHETKPAEPQPSSSILGPSPRFLPYRPTRGTTSFQKNRRKPAWSSPTWLTCTSSKPASK